MHIAWAAMVLAAGAADVNAERRLTIDSKASTVDFDIALLWMVKRTGQFHRLAGSATIDGDRARIDARLPVASATMKNKSHAETLKSEAYFDAANHPWIRFRSAPFEIASGTLTVPGTLSMRGVERDVEFEVVVPACLQERPVRACAIEVRGEVKRSDFGMVANRRTLSDKVRLTISAVVNETAPP